MGFRFRKRVPLFPGAWINLNKRGGSLSVDGHGATLNFGPKGVIGTVGLPGSGSSYRTSPIVRSGRKRGVTTSRTVAATASELAQAGLERVLVGIKGWAPPALEFPQCFTSSRPSVIAARSFDGRKRLKKRPE